MRILYLHQYFNTPSMSGGSRSYEMGRRLVALGHSVVLLTTDRERVGKAWQVSDEAGIEVHWYPSVYSNTMGYAARILSFFRFVFASFARARQLEYDLVFATSTPLTIAIPGVWAARRRRVPMVFEVRDLWPAVPVALGAIKNRLAIKAAEALERFAYRNSARIVALAPGMKEHIAAKGYPAELISVIPNGCDAYIFADGSQPSPDEAAYPFLRAGRKVAVYAGTLGLVNGTEWIVRIAKETLAVDPDLLFVFIGEGRKKADSVRLAESLGVLGVNTFFLPQMPKLELSAWLRRSDAAFVTIEGPEFYVRDSVCNKFFDAISAGKPVFSNHHGFSTDIAVQAGCGKFLPADAREAAEIVVDALRDGSWQASAAKSAHELATTTFARERQAAELERTLSEALGDAKRPGQARRQGRG